jgi:hypothetical protein
MFPRLISGPTRPLFLVPRFAAAVNVVMQVIFSTSLPPPSPVHPRKSSSAAAAVTKAGLIGQVPPDKSQRVVPHPQTFTSFRNVAATQLMPQYDCGSDAVNFGQLTAI